MLREFSWLTDENIHPEVVRFLRNEIGDVLDVKESGLVGASDAELIRISYREGRIIVTHDSDFGKLALAASESYVGIVYLRPGHIDPQHTLDTLRAILSQEMDVAPPFMLVAGRARNKVNIRLRNFGAST